MELSERPVSGETRTVRLEGSFDIFQRVQLVRMLDECAGVRRLVVDLRAVRYIDAACLGALIHVRRQRLDTGREMQVLLEPGSLPHRAAVATATLAALGVQG